MANSSSSLSSALKQFCEVPLPEPIDPYGLFICQIDQFAQAVITKYGKGLKERCLAMEVARAFIYQQPEIRAFAKEWNEHRADSSRTVTLKMFESFWSFLNKLPPSEDPRQDFAELWKPVRAHIGPEEYRKAEEFMLVDEVLRRLGTILDSVLHQRVFGVALKSEDPINAIGNYLSCHLDSETTLLTVLDLFIYVLGAEALSKKGVDVWLSRASSRHRVASVLKILSLFPSADAGFDACCRGKTPFLLQKAVCDPDAEALLALRPWLSKLSPDRRAELLLPDDNGWTPLHRASFFSGHEGIIQLLHETFSSEELAPCYSVRAGFDGDTPLSLMAWASSRPAEDLQELLFHYPADALAEALKPCPTGITPLHRAVMSDVPQKIKFVISLYDETGFLECLWARNCDGNNFLHTACGRPNAEALIALTNAVPVQYLNRLVPQPNQAGQTPFIRAAWGKAGIRERMIEIFGPEILARGLIPGKGGRSVVYHPQRIGDMCYPLLQEYLPCIPSDSDRVRAIGHGLPSLMGAGVGAPSPLIKFFPTPEDRIRLIIGYALTHNVLVGYLANMKEFIQGEKDFTEELQTAYNLIQATKHKLEPRLATPFTRLQEQLLDYSNELKVEAHASHSEREKKRIDGKVTEDIWWRKQLSMALYFARAKQEDIFFLVPLFLRMQLQLNYETRKRFNEVIMDLKLGDPDCLERLRSWLSSVSKTKASCYQLLLMRLADRGVRSELILAFRDRVAKHGATFHEGHSHGKALLDALFTLLEERLFEAEDLNAIMERLLMAESESAFIVSLLSIGQITSLGQTGKLLAVALRSTRKSLSEIAQDCFLERVSMPPVENFMEKFQERILSQRESTSLYTYAAKASREQRVSKALGTWVHSVLEGTFLDKRYAADNSPHLKKLYALDPSLLTVLPGLCKAMGKKRVGDLASSSKELRFPLERSDIQTKILTDKHIPKAEERFPLLMEFLQEKMSYQDLFAEIKTLVHPLNTRLSRQGKRKTRDEALEKQLATQIAELRFQQFLAKLCGAKTRKQKTALLGKVREHASKLENLGQFKADIEGGVKVLGRAATSPTGQLQVSLSDHYWDLFRIGSDIQGSCQNVNSAFSTNSCLLGYVLDGKTLPIVVKEPGQERIVARRLLRVEVEKDLHGNERPALFLERLYSNYQQSEIDEAIVGFAKMVADRLDMPLYSNTVPRNKMINVTLHSHGSCFHRVYSDAGGGGGDGQYQIQNPQLVHQPIIRPIAASSTL